MSVAYELQSKFRAKFGEPGKLYAAPGRVNLIGEHTDYNDGFVMPAAINRFCCLAASRRLDGILAVYSEQFDQLVETAMDRIGAATKHWSSYPFGVAWVLRRDGIPLTGANVYIASEVPVGAGLSSSAALEVSVGYALLDLAGQPIDRIKLALVCQRAENDFVGARCGIMDQMIASLGCAGKALMLDCRSLGFEMIALPQDIKLVICNTMVKHELAAGEYNVRRAECEEAVSRLSEVLPAVHSLRDVSMEQLNGNRELLTETLFRRCRHVLTENERVHQMAHALQQGDNQAIGPLMAASHRSLCDDFQVSCRELDLMVEIAARQPGVIGARMTGGGFGGCTVNLTHAADTGRILEAVGRQYAAETGIHPDIYVCEAVGGVTAVDAAQKAAKRGDLRN